MKLSKRYFRSLKSNASFYIAATVLTITTLFLFFMMYMAGEAIGEYGDTFFETQKREDANFTTYLPIADDEIEDLEKNYNVQLEKQYYMNVETDGITARVFKKTTEINLFDVTDGRENLTDDEIIISRGYALANEVGIGEEIRIGNKTYRVTGFFLRPDYLYMLQNENDSYKNVTTFFLAYMTDEAFEELGSLNCNYLIRYGEDNQEDFRKAVNEKYYMRSYLSAKENLRIEMVPFQADMFIVMSYIILAIMPLIVVVLVSVVLDRKVKSEQKMIGTLTALGYGKGQLMRHYSGFAMLPGLFGGLVSVILATIFAQPFGEVGLADYEPMPIVCRMNPVAAVLALVVPTVMYVLAAMRAVRKLLKKDTVLLLHGNAEQGKKTYKHLLIKSKVSFRFKYAVRSLFGNLGRSFVVLLGIFLGSFIVLLGYCLVDTMNYSQKVIVNEMGSYEYQYVLGELFTDNVYGGEPLLMSTIENLDGEQFSIIGTSNENPYLNLKDASGQTVDLEKGYFITNVVAVLQDVTAGDKMTIRNPLTLEEYEIKVAGIIDNDMLNAVITDKEKVADIVGIDETLSNVIMSDKALDIPEEKIIQTLKKADTKEQFETINEMMNAMIYLVIALGAIICVAAIYVAVDMLVTENRANISMLKVLGYGDRQINRIVLNVNHVLLPAGIAISIPLVIASTDFFMEWLADFMGMLPKTYIAPQSFVYTVALTALSYFGSLALLRRKVSKVDMVESLKDNRE